MVHIYMASCLCLPNALSAIGTLISSSSVFQINKVQLASSYLPAERLNHQAKPAHCGSEVGGEWFIYIWLLASVFKIDKVELAFFRLNHQKKIENRDDC